LPSSADRNEPVASVDPYLLASSVEIDTNKSKKRVRGMIKNKKEAS
jgi:hypothetical protein